MPKRDDHQYYEFDIREMKTGEVKRVPIFAYWSGEASIAERRRMCDCQLGAFFTARPEDLNTLELFYKGSTTNVITLTQNAYLTQHKCNHKPSKKYVAERAYLTDGEVIEIAA